MKKRRYRGWTREEASRGGRTTMALHGDAIHSAGGKVSGPITIRLMTPQTLSLAGRIGSCQRWNIRRGKPCVCGRHQN